MDQNLDFSKMDNFSELLLKQVIDSNSNVYSFSLLTFFADSKIKILDFRKLSHFLQYSIIDFILKNKTKIAVHPI
jgi:hypothetical protein